MSYSESTFADPKPDVTDLRGEPAACEVCGEDASEYPCELGSWCDDHHAESSCRIDACWAVEYDYDE